MEIKVNKSRVVITDRQNNYIEKKVKRLKKIAGRFWNTATKIVIEFKDDSKKASNNEVGASMKMPLPGNTLYANSSGQTVEAVIDDLEEKMIQQIDKYKGKREKRSVKGDVKTARVLSAEAVMHEVLEESIVAEVGEGASDSIEEADLS